MTVESSGGRSSFAPADSTVALGNGVNMELNLLSGNLADPLGRYTLTNDFYIMTTEVTQEMFVEVMGATPETGHPLDQVHSLEILLQTVPVYVTSWHMAAGFCQSCFSRQWSPVSATRVVLEPTRT